MMIFEKNVLVSMIFTKKLSALQGLTHYLAGATYVCFQACFRLKLKISIFGRY